MGNQYDREPDRATPWRAVSTSIFSDELFRDDAELVAWLLMFGRYARSMPTGELKRGQFDCSMTELARRFQKREDARGKNADPNRWNRGKARSFCKRLARNGSLSFEAIKGRSGITRFTILKYDKWQYSGKNSARSPHAGSTQPARSGHAGTPNKINDLEDSVRSPHAGSTQPARSGHAHRETGSKRQVLRDNSTAVPAAPVGAGGKVFIDERGNEWTAPPKKGAPTYSMPFEEIWKVWLDYSKSNPELIKAVGKAKTYRMCFQHLKAGTADAAALYRASVNYLKSCTTGKRQSISKHPATFYCQQDPHFVEYTGPIAGGIPGAVNLRPWSNPISAYVEVNRAARKLGLPLPTFGKFSATWEQIESMPDEVLELARANA